jgi:hypothetical protein
VWIANALEFKREMAGEKWDHSLALNTIRDDSLSRWMSSPLPGRPQSERLRNAPPKSRYCRRSADLTEERTRDPLLSTLFYLPDYDRQP